MNKKVKGISLIVLVITIIVMIIIAGAIILSLTNTNVIAKAKEGRAKNEISLLKEQWSRAYSEALADTGGVVPLEQAVKDKFGALNIPTDYLVTLTGIQYIGSDAVKRDAAIALGVEVVSGLGVGTIATVNTTVNGSAAAYNNPIIPKGFKAINDSTTWPTGWDDGLVIEDSVGNQFVWVPVDEIDVPYAKWTSVAIAYNAGLSEDALPTGITNETNQISAYGGFYIARYEAGNISNVLVSKKNVTPLGTITYFNSSTKAVAMYNTPEVKSGLLTGTQVDTVLKWIENSGKSVTDSRAWGNSIDSIVPANVSGFATMQTTGYSEYWKAKNIYDFAGNISEWTNEGYGSLRIWRSSYAGFGGIAFPVAYRYAYDPNYVVAAVGFRVALFIV